MRAYKNNKREAAKKDNEKPVDEKILGDLYHIYYKNRDLNLFLELLAMGSGVAPAISFMTLFDSVRRLKHHRQKDIHSIGTNLVFVTRRSILGSDCMTLNSLLLKTG